VGYPELDEQAKRNILGLNSAKLYGLQVGTVGADQEGQNEGENEDGRYGRIPANFASRITDAQKRLWELPPYDKTLNLTARNDNLTKYRERYQAWE